MKVKTLTLVNIIMTAILFSSMLLAEIPPGLGETTEPSLWFDVNDDGKMRMDDILWLALADSSEEDLAGNLTNFAIDEPSNTSGTVYIKADGSVYPLSSPISTVDNITYTFTDNIFDSIVVERDNIILDGASYTLQGSGGSIGVKLVGRSNVTVMNIKISFFDQAIYLEDSSNNYIIGNDLTQNEEPVFLRDSSNNSISQNRLADNHYGIILTGSSNNIVSGNNITNSFDAISIGTLSLNNLISDNIGENTVTCINLLGPSSFNTVQGNKIRNNAYGLWLLTSSGNTVSENSIMSNTQYGIWFFIFSEYNQITENDIKNNWIGAYIYMSSNNEFYHNNFIDNILQVITLGSTNLWDDGYPSGGNHWSDYTGVDSYSGPYQNETGDDGIGDTPYLIDGSNTDGFPFMDESGWATPARAMQDLIDTVELMNLQQGIDNSLDAKLTAALDALEAVNAGQREDAINKLNAFINEVEAQREKKITNEQADCLIAKATAIIDLTG